jgi:cytoskeletal protein CcmA (bactofilin family)
MSNDQNLSRAGGIESATVTIIGETMRIQGALTSSTEVHLNGHLEGQLDVVGRLTIGAGGKADVNIKASDVIVAGSAKGNIETMGRVVLHAGASLEGDVKAAGIMIEDGAYFKGEVDIARQPSSER